MEKIQYVIDKKNYDVSLVGSPKLEYGKPEFLSNSETDISFGQDWYKAGFETYNFLNEVEFDLLKSGLTQCISKIVSEHVENIEGFSLDNYHHFVKSDEVHHKVVAVTRHLFPADFNFPLNDIITRFEKLIGFGLTDTDPDSGDQLQIIIRINRPRSKDFNPPHKDIYEGWDRESILMKFVNLWIPIAGVNNLSSLPVVPGSHLMSEDKILRTFEGGILEGKQYRVRAVAEWDGSNELVRPEVDYGEVLMFSAHLIHGLAFNDQEDQTRVALEFRLFKKG